MREQRTVSKTVTFHLPVDIYQKLNDVSETFHVSKKDLIIGMIDKELFKRYMPKVIFEKSEQYTRFMESLNILKSKIGRIGIENQKAMSINKSYLDLALSSLQVNDQKVISDKDKLDKIIENQNQILNTLSELKQSLDNKVNPLLKDLNI